MLLKANFYILAQANVKATFQISNDVNSIKPAHKKSPISRQDCLKLVAGAGFEPTVPRSGIISLRGLSNPS